MASGERLMYRWRQMTPEQRRSILRHRKRHKLPWHTPPHVTADTSLYLMTAACYEHRPVLGLSPERMAAFEDDLLAECRERCRVVFSRVVLPKHYHGLVDTPNVKALLKALGQLHGRTSFQWNGEEECRGRKVWFSATEAAMKSERHFGATRNYVLHNPVRHGYVERWQDWPYSTRTNTWSGSDAPRPSASGASTRS